MTISREMPKYRCHKEVWALKIKEAKCVDSDNGHYLTPEDPDYAAVYMDGDWCTKHEPHAGGYYVVYRDGYASFSPADAFESGYSLID